MKKLMLKSILLLFPIMLSISALAQDNETKRETYNAARDTVVADTTEKREPRLDVGGISFNRNEEGDLRVDIRLGSMFSLGFNTLLFNGDWSLPSELGYLEMELGKSTHFKWDVIRSRLGRRDQFVGLEYGVAVSYNNYAFTSGTRFTPNVESVQFTVEDRDFKKNKLKTVFLEIPLMLSLRSKNSNGFNLSAGGYAGIMLKSKQKFKFANNDKEKIKDDFNMNKFRWGLQGIVGFGNVKVYTQYSLTNLYKDNEGPELTPFNVGIVLAGF